MTKYCIPQLAHSIILSLGSLTFGYVMGYTSVAADQLKHFYERHDIKVNGHLFPFFISVSSLAAIFGSFVTRGLVSPRLKFGRKYSCLILAIAGTIFWLLLLATGRSIWIGIVARAGLGLTIGAFSALVPMYVVELSPAELTGVFGVIPQTLTAFGIVVTNLVGSLVDWDINAVIGACVTGLLCLLIFLVPESPAVVQHTPSIAAHVASESICSRKWMAEVCVACCFMVFQQLTGINVIVTTLGSLFANAHVRLDVGYASAISSFAQVIATICAGLFISRLGRRVIWVLSFAGVTITDFLYGLYNHESLKGVFPWWFPIIVVFTNFFAFGLGAGPIPWFIVSEMFPTIVRATANSIAVTCNWIFTFLVVQGGPYLQDEMGDWGTFMLFAVVSLSATVFGIFYVKKPDVEEEQMHKNAYDDLVSS
jgi:MFS family permease